jgi:hypothetical protein
MIRCARRVLLLYTILIFLSIVLVHRIRLTTVTRNLRSDGIP